MGIQSTYPLSHSAAVAGALVDGQLRNIRSAVAEVAIPFGRVVVRGSADGRVKLPTASADITGSAPALVMGISIRALDDAASSSDVAQYEIGRNVSFIDFGVVWGITEEACVQGDQVFARYAAGGSGRGTFGTTVGTSERASLTSGRFLASASAGALVPIRIRMVTAA